MYQIGQLMQEDVEVFMFTHLEISMYSTESYFQYF